MGILIDLSDKQDDPTTEQKEEIKPAPQDHEIRLTKRSPNRNAAAQPQLPKDILSTNNTVKRELQTIHDKINQDKRQEAPRIKAEKIQESQVTTTASTSRSTTNRPTTTRQAATTTTNYPMAYPNPTQQGILNDIYEFKSSYPTFFGVLGAVSIIFIIWRTSAIQPR
jgi:outer membrane biosynthesis protein TonB